MLSDWPSFSRKRASPGVLNIVHGAQETVEALIAAPEVQAVSFVGSAPVARHIYEEAARHGARASAGRRQEPHRCHARR